MRVRAHARTYSTHTHCTHTHMHIHTGACKHAHSCKHAHPDINKCMHTWKSLSQAPYHSFTHKVQKAMASFIHALVVNIHFFS